MVELLPILVGMILLSEKLTILLQILILMIFILSGVMVGQYYMEIITTFDYGIDAEGNPEIAAGSWRVTTNDIDD